MSNRIFVALDTPKLDDALRIVRRVRHHVGGVKLGLEFFCANGHGGVHAVAVGADAKRVFAGCAFIWPLGAGSPAVRAGAAGEAGAADTAGLTPSSTAAAHTTAKAAVVGRTRR